MSEKKFVFDIESMRKSPFYSVFTQQDEMWKQILEGYERKELSIQDLAYCCFYIGIDFCVSYTDHVYTEMTDTALNIVRRTPEEGSASIQPGAEPPDDENNEFVPEEHL